MTELIPGMGLWKCVAEGCLIVTIHVLFGLFKLTVGKMTQLDACPDKLDIVRFYDIKYLICLDEFFSLSCLI